MLTITKPATRHEGVSYVLAFDYTGHTGWGFMFDCDAAGNVRQPLNEAAAENLRRCLSGEIDVVARGVQARPFSYRVPAEGRCECGRVVVLEGDTDCDCGRIYNGSGQELNPRWMWGEETGETFEAAPYGADW